MPADLLLLHGFTQTRASWAGVMRALVGRYRPIAPDLGAGPWEAELDRLEALAPLAHEDRLRRSAADHAAQLRGLGTGVMSPLWERLGELAMPVALVVG